MPAFLRALLAKPFLHFALLGALAFAWWSPESLRRNEVVQISGEEIARIRSDLSRRSGFAPSPAELRDALWRAAAEEALVREAIALGLHRRDPVIRARLVRNLRFLEGSELRGAGEPDDRNGGALFERAVALGLERSDLIVRRRLVQQMEDRLSARDAEEPLPEDEVAEAIEEERARQPGAPRFVLRHVFLPRAQRAEWERVTTALRSRNVEGSQEPAGMEPLGAPFLLGSTLGPTTEQDLADRMGAEFARSVLQASVGRWEGPVPSSYGAHWIHVERRLPPVARSDATIRAAAVARLREQQRSRALREAIASILRSYDVEFGSADGTSTALAFPRRDGAQPDPPRLDPSPLGTGPAPSAESS